MANNNESPFITTGERVRSFIGWAFVISIVVHFLFAPFLKNLTQHSDEQTVEKVSVTKRIIVKPPTPPPPTPTPPPPKTTPPPKHQVTQPQPKLVVHPPKTHSNSASTTTTENKYVAPPRGSENGNPNGTQASGPPGPVSTPGPPASTPKPACKTPYQDATAVQAVTPDYPEQAREQGLGEVQVTVIVTISPTGGLVNATIGQGSGNMSIDQAALSAARQSTYAPKIVDCQPVEGTYNFKVTFDPNS